MFLFTCALIDRGWRSQTCLGTIEMEIEIEIEENRKEEKGWVAPTVFLSCVLCNYVLSGMFGRERQTYLNGRFPPVTVQIKHRI